MDETQQRESTRYREEQFKDEIELMDYLRVMWKWKYLIVGGTLICAIAAGVISFSIHIPNPSAHTAKDSRFGWLFQIATRKLQHAIP